jgi:hypothetical protein
MTLLWESAFKQHNQFIHHRLKFFSRRVSDSIYTYKIESVPPGFDRVSIKSRYGYKDYQILQMHGKFTQVMMKFAESFITIATVLNKRRDRSLSSKLIKK